MTEPKPNLGDFTLEELTARLSELGEPTYRAVQVFNWLYRKGAEDFASMTNLPAALRHRLTESFSIVRPVAAERRRAADGTEKILFRLAGGGGVETVLIPSPPRLTLCLSTQFGCRFGCVFCASGRIGFKRNLTPSEIVGQVLQVQFREKRPVTNLVFMGMGEPFDNYENLTAAIRILNHPHGLNIGARKLTVSTCGLVPQIEAFRELGLQVELSISLHAADEELRSRLMPVNRRYPLAELLPAAARYTRETGRQLTLEYLLMAGVNDGPEAARQLAETARRLGAKVNLINFNPVPGLPFKPAPEPAAAAFQKGLRAAGVNVTRRRSRGAGVGAACGQLAGES
ncbi:MAG TPA: 23S rRNA (adenine(2503)-C(2))-methyltransferase RlmN [bacterium]|nr:23S rRNA (adenine(2503)-C(2))-methyltransferase RlmN [bacterium]